MEAQKQSESHSQEQERGGAREVLRGIVRRRVERRAGQAVRGTKRRLRAFGRGARVGYAIQENPGKAAAATFVLGCILGAVALGLYQVLGDFQTLVEEELPEEEETHAAA